MKPPHPVAKIALFLLAALAPGLPAKAQTIDALIAEALAGNPELRFYEKQLAALPKPAKADAPTIPQPLDFPSRERFRAAVLNLDADLARMHFAEFQFVLAAEVRLTAMEYQAATEVAAHARALSADTSSLVKMLAERPAAGVPAFIERRILEGAALPFLRKAAEADVRRGLLRTKLNGLLGRAPDADLAVTGDAALPPEATAASEKAGLLLEIREAEIARAVGGFGAASKAESFAIGGWFTRAGLGAGEAVAGITRPGGSAGSTIADTRARLLDDARAKLLRETTQRAAAVRAAREVATAISPQVLEDLRAASELAGRQYRVGALGVNLLVEVNREYLDALEARNEALIQAWRNSLDLDLLNLPSPPAH